MEERVGMAKGDSLEKPNNVYINLDKKWTEPWTSEVFENIGKTVTEERA